MATTACRGMVRQHLVGGFLGTTIAVLTFSFLTRDPMIVLGTCLIFGITGWFHRQIYASVGTSASEIKVAWTTFRARQVTIEQKIARLRMAAILLFVPCAFGLTMFAASKVDSIMSPALPVAIWGFLLTAFSLTLKSEWTDGPFANANRQAERAQYERGRAYFFVRKLLELVWIGSVFAAIAVAHSLYYGMTIALAIIIGFTMICVRLARKILYLAAKHAEAGICVTTGLAVTAWVTITYLPSADGPIRAVRIAVFAGLLAAAISIVISKGIVIFFESDAERRRLVTSQVMITFTEEYAPQLVRVFNIGWHFFYRQIRLVKRVLPAEPRMRPLTIRLIPRPFIVNPIAP